jgi:hypothetical protein
MNELLTLVIITEAQKSSLMQGELASTCSIKWGPQVENRRWLAAIDNCVCIGFLTRHANRQLSPTAAGIKFAQSLADNIWGRQ